MAAAPLAVMKQRGPNHVVVPFAIGLLATFAGAAPTQWGYRGPVGPGHWGELSTAFAACATGRQQSPIDLHGATPAELPALEADYPATPWTSSNNGHTVAFSGSTGTLRIGDDTYKLEQVHFHHPSEHTLDGRRFPLELHAVHRGPKGLAVIGVLFEPGAANPTLAQLFRTLPARPGDHATVATLDVSPLLTTSQHYFTYAGSLTTPPCSEHVRWIVLAAPMTADAHELDAFARLFPDNSRPVQRLDGRRIEVSR